MSEPFTCTGMFEAMFEPITCPAILTVTEPYRPWRVAAPRHAVENAAREAVQNVQWRLAYGRAAAEAASARESVALVHEIVDDILDCVIQEACACCICYNLPKTYAPMCATHTQNACSECVMALHRHGVQTCPMCREPLVSNNTIRVSMNSNSQGPEDDIVWELVDTNRTIEGGSVAIYFVHY